MFTQCPQCGSYFRVRSEQLSAADGYVRCSLCTTTFDALERLHTRVPKKHRQETDEDTPPESEIPSQTTPDLFADDGHAASAPESDEGASGATPAPHDEDRDQSVPEAKSSESTADEPGASRKAEAAEVESETTAPVWFDPPKDTPEKSRQGLWLAGCLLMLLTLAAQTLHFDREHWRDNPAIGSLVENFYAGIGHPMPEPRDLGAIEIVSSSVSEDPTRPGELRVTAVLENTADHEQPVPAIFLRLENRWGGSVGSGFLDPEIWVTGREMPERFEPGQRLALGLDLADAEREAVGFHIEPCWREAGAYHCLRGPRG